MLPFGNDKLDMIVAFESAQHFQSIDNFLEVSKSILKPGGLIVTCNSSGRFKTLG